MEKFSRIVLIRIIIVLVGVILGLLQGFGFINIEVIFGIIAALMLLMVELMFEIKYDLQSKSFGQSEFERFATKNRTLLGVLARSSYREIQNALQVVDGGFFVQHKDLAISSYYEFWKLLVLEQRKASTKLNVKVVHSCGIDIWLNHPLTKPLLDIQEEFIDLEGSICRILCGKANAPNSDIQEAAEEMKNAKIDVRYYPLNSNAVVDHNFAWDFLLVPEKNLAAIWDSFAHAPGGVIDKAVYNLDGEYRSKILADLWNVIHKASFDFPFSKDE